MSGAGEATVVVQTGPERYELRRLPLPPTGSDDGLVAIDACGVCGTDLEVFTGLLGGVSWPIVPGHEPIGTIMRLGSDARRRWGVEEGDRVAILSQLRCGRCYGCMTGGACRSGKYSDPMSGGFSTYGFRSPELVPGLWGGFASHLYLAPEAVLLPIPPTTSVAAASLFNVMANGVHWAIELGRVRPGLKCAILGCGPRGLASLIAARVAGSDRVAVTGLSTDADRLSFATELGADAVVTVGADNTLADLCDALGGFPDVVIDTTPISSDAVVDAIALAAPGGTVVLAGLKGAGATVPVEIDVVITKRLTLRGALSRTPEAAMLAIRIISSNRFPFEKFASHAYGLGAAEQAVRALAPQTTPRPMHVRIEPALGRGPLAG